MIGMAYMRIRGGAPLSFLLSVAFLALASLLPVSARADSSLPSYADSALPSYSEQWIYYPNQTEPSSRETMVETIMAAHNDERRHWNVPPLTWDARLAADARSHAHLLAQKGYLQHASMEGRPDPQGENLWMGTRDAFGYEQMMAGFLDERRHYKPRAIPDISKTGNWLDTGHYSQIIWRTTTSVGCALASNREFDFLVCRYSPAGNIWGMRADEGGPAVTARAEPARAYWPRAKQRNSLLRGQN